MRRQTFLFIVMCGCSPVGTIDAGAFVSSDAGVIESMQVDAGEGLPDAGSVVRDAGQTDVGGCFEAPVTIGSFPTRGRQVLQIGNLAAFEHGWVLTIESAGGPRLLFVDHAGTFIANEEPPEFVGRIWVEGTHAIVLGAFWAHRLELGPRGISHVFPSSEFVGRGGSGERAEGVLDAEQTPGRLRLLSHHYDTVASKSKLRLSELEFDETSASGLRQRTGELVELANVDPFYVQRFVLAGVRRGDFLFVYRAPRLRRFQLGSGGLPAVIPVRDLGDEERPAFGQVTADRDGVVNAQGDGGLEIRALWDVTAAPIVLDAARVLEPAWATRDLGDGRVMVVTSTEVLFFERFSGRAVGPAISLEPLRTAPSTASRPGAAAIAWVAGDEVHLRCVALP